MAVLGAYTGCDLGDARPLLARETLAYRPDTARLALELSAAAYDMRAEKWLDAGWQDISVQVDDKLYTGLNAGGGLAERLGGDIALSRARARKERMNPVSQYLGLRRQRVSPDTCKALVMLRPLPGRRYVLCVAFMGTGKRLYDWSGNLLLTSENGVHAGFLALTRQFEGSAERVLFPRAARQMGLQRLTLGDALRALSRPDSPFSLFVAGHSQGAALTQLYISRRLLEGALRQNVLGYGFASPCVRALDALPMEADAPVVNIINADDVIARLGGEAHLGLCRVMPACDALRALCQGEKAFSEAYCDALWLLRAVRSTPDALALGIALTEALSALPDAQAEEALSFLAPDFLPDRLTLTLAGYARRLAAYAARALNKKYTELTNEPLPGALAAAFRRRVDAPLARHGAKAFLEALTHCLYRAHALCGREERAYQHIVNAFSGALRVSLWRQDAPAPWAERFAGVRRGRAFQAPYDRFHPFSTLRRRAKSARRA